VVSNFDRRLYGILAGLGLAQWFDAVVVSSEVGSAKPDPEIFRVASSRLFLAPSQLAHVGDREEDVVGAERAGLRAWRICRDGNPGPGEIRSLLELPSLVEG
jgi:putative hydrolase of the HAD superfamily